MKIIKALSIVSLIIVVGGAVIYFLRQNNPSVVYKNSLLGYEISIPPDWHVSEMMSKKMDDALFTAQLASSIGCNISNIAGEGGNSIALTKKLEDCMKNSPELNNIELKHADFLKNWTIENARNVYITNMTSEEESKSTLTDISMPGDRLPKGSFITIRPFDFVLDFSEDASLSNKSGLKRSFFYLADGTKTYLSDWRDSKISQNGLNLSVPISSGQEFFNGEELKNIKSISIMTTAKKNSQQEKDFINSIGSFNLLNS